MKELQIDVFYLDDNENYKMGDKMMLEISKGLYVKVQICGIYECVKDKIKWRKFKILK